MVDAAENRRSEDAVDAAEVILGRYLKPGQWPARAARLRFTQSGQLEHVLSLYEEAMATDPREPAYSWNHVRRARRAVAQPEATQPDVLAVQVKVGVGPAARC